MYIDTGLEMEEHRFQPMDKDDVEYIVLHHTGVEADQTVETINNFHRFNRGWAGIGYHFYIRPDGQIYKGREVTVQGVHTPGANNKSIGICLTGNFNYSKPNADQIESVVKLIRWLNKNYKKLEIVGHRDKASSQCPGDKFPLEEIKEMVGGKMTKEKKEIEWVNVYVKSIKVEGCLINSTLFIPARDSLELLNNEIEWKSDEREAHID